MIAVSCRPAIHEGCSAGSNIRNQQVSAGCGFDYKPRDYIFLRASAYPVIRKITASNF